MLGIAHEARFRVSPRHGAHTHLIRDFKPFILEHAPVRERSMIPTRCYWKTVEWRESHAWYTVSRITVRRLVSRMRLVGEHRSLKRPSLFETCL